MTHESAVVLAEAYEGATTVIAGLGEDDRRRPTGCAGWSIDALVAHMLLDAQRSLIALASEVHREPYTDAVSYWRAWNPSVEPAARDSHAGFVTRLGHAYSSMQVLTTQWAHTAQAAVRAAASADQGMPLVTQDHVLTVADLCRTLVVEAVVHHLDLVTDLPEAPEPAAAPLAVTRETLDGLWGRAAPEGWDATTYVRRATGREPLSDADHDLLGASAARLPLLG